jgi:hypothetical protein
MELNRPLLSYAGGLLSKKLFGRTDLQTHFTGASILRNFFTSVQGPMSFRPGSRYVIPTRGNDLTHLIPFVFNEEQAYALAFSHEKLRFLSNGGIITEPEVAISGITQDDPGVITSSAHGLANGDQIFLEKIVGMTELNGKTFLVANKTGNTFTLTDLDGDDIDTSDFEEYSSAGVFEKIYEIDTPFHEDDLEGIRVAQKADLMYVNHREYDMFKLRRFGENDWRLETYTRTNDPFTKAVSGATQANPCVITATAHDLLNGDYIEINGVEGMTQLNGNVYQITRIGDDSFSLDGINSTGYDAYTSGGYLFKVGNMPGALAFFGGRVFHGGTDDEPETFWGSRAPSDTGESRFDDFTVGADKDHAVVFPIASQNNTADRIFWFAGNHKFLAIGTLGGVYKAYGEAETAPITGTDINVVPVDFFGSSRVVPIRIGTTLFYVQRGGLIVNKFMYDVMSDGFVSDDINVLSDEITKSGIKQITSQQGAVAMMWAVRNDGALIALSIKEQEKIMSWHQHVLGGEDVKVLSICGEPQPDRLDNMWMVVERTINGVTRRHIEYFEAEEPVPEFEDFYTDEDHMEEDTERYRKVQWEFAKHMLRVDSALIYDASQTVTLTPAAKEGEDIVFTAGASLFTDADVGRRIVKKYITGDESGIAEITAVNSATEVECKILSAFDSTDAMTSGKWYLTITEISGLDHLEGEEVAVVADASVHPVQTVEDGKITLDDPSTVVQVGLKYVGRYRSMPLEAGGIRDAAQTRTTIVNKVGLVFRHSLGVKCGTSPYNLEEVLFRDTNDYTDRPPMLFSGVQVLNVEDNYEEQKFIEIIQDNPLPCTIQAIVPFVDTTNE